MFGKDELRANCVLRAGEECSRQQSLSLWLVSQVNYCCRECQKQHWKAHKKQLSLRPGWI
jgi:hypothetical protein